MTSEQHTSVSETPAAPENEDLSFAEMLARQEEGEHIHLEVGQRVSVRIVAITADTIFVSTGSKVDGIVEREEMETDGELPYQVGDTLDLYVITATPQEVRLSRVMSGDGSLSVLEDARNNHLPVEGRITGQVKGGYTVDIMKRRAFCPLSQVDVRPLEDPESVINQTFFFLITKLENHGRNIVVSRRDLLERERAEVMEQLLAEMKEGDVREGTVTRLAPFGAFVELAPGVEGMVHVSELSWSRADRPEDAVRVGDTVRVKVQSVSREAKGVRIALSIKAAMDDPWSTAGQRLSVGEAVSGVVTRLAPFGAFVELLPGVEGMIHLSELSFEKRINKAEEVVSPGDAVTVKIKEIDPEKRRIALSLRDVAGNPWERVTEILSVGADVLGTMEKRAPFGLFVTLAPGITGLLPNQAVAASPRRKDLERLTPGEAVTVRIREIDAAKRRVSLLPGGEDAVGTAGGDDWKQHAPKKESSSLGALGLALQEAKARKTGK